jgi:hypothetical protein
VIFPLFRNIYPFEVNIFLLRYLFLPKTTETFGAIKLRRSFGVGKRYSASSFDSIYQADRFESMLLPGAERDQPKYGFRRSSIQRLARFLPR